MSSALRSFAILLASCCFVACSGESRPPAIQDTSADASASSTTVRNPPVCATDGSVAPPLPNALGLCGNTFLKATVDPPNIYFVIDRSGSMHDIVDGTEKYTAVANASIRLVERLGSQANVGAAVFPGPRVNRDHPCLAGEEIFPTTGPHFTGPCGDIDLVPNDFARAITLPPGTVPVGSTPTAATLTALLPILTALAGKTTVILATDGGPNCNTTTGCKLEDCIPNIERICTTAICCDSKTNCCDPVTGAGPESCLDKEPTTRAVAALLEHGIKTYVVGIPGSGPYAALLDQLAIAGGTARDSSTAYYDVQHISELDNVLASIGATVVLGCHLRLDVPPPDPALVNIYLDQQLLALGDKNGWRWSAATSDSGVASEGGAAESGTASDSGTAGGATAESGTASGATSDSGIEDASAPGDASSVDDAALGAEGTDSGLVVSELDIVGSACSALQSGTVHQVQITFGCPTENVH